MNYERDPKNKTGQENHRILPAAGLLFSRGVCPDRIRGAIRNLSDAHRGADLHHA